MVGFLLSRVKNYCAQKMYKKYVQTYLTKVVNANLGTNYLQVDLEPEVLVHLVPCGTSIISKEAKSIAMKDIKSLASVSLEYRFPAIKNKHCRERYHAEVMALTNLINYFIERPWPHDKSFTEVFEAFVIDTCGPEYLHAGSCCCFEEESIIYIVPIDIIADVIKKGVNPHTNKQLQVTTLNALKSRYSY